MEANQLRPSRPGWVGGGHGIDPRMHEASAVFDSNVVSQKTRGQEKQVRAMHISKYWFESAAAERFGIGRTRLQRAVGRNLVKIARTKCGKRIYLGSSVRKFADGVAVAKVQEDIPVFELYTEQGAAKATGISRATLYDAARNGTISSKETGCGQRLLEVKSTEAYAKEHKPYRRLDGIIRRRRTKTVRPGGHSVVHAVPDVSLPAGPALCGMSAEWGDAVTGKAKDNQISCSRCQEKATYKKVS